MIFILILTHKQSTYFPQKKADVAHTVEQLIRNQQVRSSILRIGSKKIEGLGKMLNPLIFSLLPYCYPPKIFFVTLDDPFPL